METSLRFSREKSELDLKMIHAVLTGSYWAEGRTREEVARSIENSLCFAVFSGKEQVAFGRVITDYVAFAYLMDVFVLEEYQGRGIGKELMEYILGQEDLKPVRRWFLGTRDAHALYEKVGFERVRFPERWMERVGK